MSSKFLFVSTLCLLWTLIGYSSNSHAAKASIRVTVPKTAYIQWLRSPGERMTQTFAAHQDVRLIGRGAPGSKDDLYLGVMCNTLGGYELRFTARDAVDRDTALARGPGGQTAEYDVNLRPISSTFRGSVNQMTNIDLRGGNSASVSFADGFSLPLKPDRPNVFHLEAVSRDTIPAGQVFLGGITVQVVVR